MFGPREFIRGYCGRAENGLQTVMAVNIVWVLLLFLPVTGFDSGYILAIGNIEAVPKVLPVEVEYLFVADGRNRIDGE